MSALLPGQSVVNVPPSGALQPCTVVSRWRSVHGAEYDGHSYVVTDGAGKWVADRDKLREA